MTLYHLHRISCIAVLAILVLFWSPAPARAQVDFAAAAQAEALSSAAKASPELAQGLAKELGSTPEQAAGAAGVLFAIAKSLLTPDDFAAVAKAVPGMDAMLAAVPPGTVNTSELSAVPGSTLSPGFASSSSATPGATMTPPDGMAAALPAFSKLGIKPEMIAKALPFLSGYLKKYGGAAIGQLLGGLFKTGK